MSTLLPLFPLELVLLPGVPLPLHIFEPRYKEMIAECLEQKLVFGVVRAKEEGITDVGCTAEIADVMKKYPDGRLDILTHGRKRFEVMEVNQERPFLRAEVLFLEDEPLGATTEEVAHATRLHEEIVALAGGKPPAVEKVDPGKMSFHLVGSLPLDLDFKQTLLAMSSESERMQAVVACFESILPNLRLAVQARQKAGGNGHVR